jgi:uncharacterized damage-inducible protein DinB
MASFQDAIAEAHGTARTLLHRYVDDLKPEEFRHQPLPGANNAGWIVGHLARTARTACERLGVTDLPPLPDGWADQFKPTKSAAAPEQPIGDPAESLRIFDLHSERLMAAVRKADDKKLAEPPPFQSPLFSNLGQMLLFLGLHTSMHAGQLSVIRRSLGKPPIT